MRTHVSRTVSLLAKSRRLGGLTVLAAAVIALWVFPLVFFSQPGVNDAIELSNWELPITLAVCGAAVLSAFAFSARLSTTTPIGLGVYLVGIAVDLRVGLAVFGNHSEDRFMPLLFIPFLVGAAGLATLAGVFAQGSHTTAELRRGALKGLTGAAFVGGWILLRGARDWLLAPYGFDITLLIALVAVVVAWGARPQSVPPT